jgi:hypothetical protein
MVAGAIEIEKSCAGVTFRLTGAVFVTDPDVPTNPSVAMPTVAVEVAVRVTGCGGFPDDRAKVAGEADTPAGRPEMATLTDAEKPLTALAETISCWLLPPA